MPMSHNPNNPSGPENPSPSRQHEKRAPISSLSTKGRYALIECSGNDFLQKHKGVWRGSADGAPINGNTVATLTRDGLLVVTRSNEMWTARLTERGEWFVRTLMATDAAKLAD